MTLPLVMVLSRAGYWVVVGLGVVLLVWRRPRGLDPQLVVLALGISVLATAVQHPLRLAGINNWWVEYLYPFPQILAFGWVAGLRKELVILAPLLLIAALASALRGPLEAPETVVQSLGGFVLAVSAVTLWRRSPDVTQRLLAGALFVYWGLTLPFTIGMAWAATQSMAFFSAWIQALHAIRLLALVGFGAWLVVSTRRPLQLVEL